eukprot:Amastigsp_a680904_5.p3 type:complete len:132 gc:universal Amastigsp_a680904_5:520-915(+)
MQRGALVPPSTKSAMMSSREPPKSRGRSAAAAAAAGVPSSAIRSSRACSAKLGGSNVLAEGSHCHSAVNESQKLSFDQMSGTRRRSTSNVARVRIEAPTTKIASQFGSTASNSVRTRLIHAMLTGASSRCK